MLHKQKALNKHLSSQLKKKQISETDLIEWNGMENAITLHFLLGYISISDQIIFFVYPTV